MKEIFETTRYPGGVFRRPDAAWEVYDPSGPSTAEFGSRAEAEAAHPDAVWVPAELPDDLTPDLFEEDFDVEGNHYRYGAWNTAGDWVLAWNTESELREQLGDLELQAD